MSSHASHRQEGRKHKHHRPLRRGSVSGSFPAARSQGLVEALRQALDDLEAERLRTTGRANPADDDEDPTRRGGARRP
jgi:hypothetical protein